MTSDWERLRQRMDWQWLGEQARRYAALSRLFDAIYRGAEEDAAVAAQQVVRAFRGTVAGRRFFRQWAAERAAERRAA